MSYNTLYSSNANRENLNDLPPAFSENITPLHETDKLSCEGKVSVEECLKARHNLKTEKSPGTDG